MFQAVKTAAVGVCAAIAFCVPAPALAAGPDLTTWLFAEGSTNGAFGFEQEILIGNPNPTPITVTFELFTQDGEALAPVVRTSSRCRATVRTSAPSSAIGPASRSGSPRVRRSLPNARCTGAAGCSAAARPGTRRSTTCAAATTSTASGGGQDLVLRRGRRQVLQHLHLGGQPQRRAGDRHRLLPRRRGCGGGADRRRARQRPTDVLADGGARPGACQPGRAGFATIVTSDLDVVAERQMYWGPGAPSGIHGGHAAAGVTTPSATWLFAEGIQGALWLG